MGEGEEVNLELMDLYAKMKNKGCTKHEFLEAAARIDGIYVPAFYNVVYNNDGTIASVKPNTSNVPATVSTGFPSTADNVQSSYHCQSHI